MSRCAAPWLGCVLLLALGGCTTTEIHVQSLGPEHTGFVTTGKLETPAPELSVLLRAPDGKLTARVRRVAWCGRTERGVEQLVQVQRTEISAATTVICGLLAASGLVVYMWPDLNAEDSFGPGTFLVAAGALPYGLAATQQSEQVDALPPRAIERPASPVQCVVEPVSGETIVIQTAGGTLEGQTDAAGRVEFQSTVTGPVVVTVGGRRVERVEWAP